MRKIRENACLHSNLEYEHLGKSTATHIAGVALQTDINVWYVIVYLSMSSCQRYSFIPSPQQYRQESIPVAIALYYGTGTRICTGNAAPVTRVGVPFPINRVFCAALPGVYGPFVSTRVVIALYLVLRYDCSLLTVHHCWIVVGLCLKLNAVRIVLYFQCQRYTLPCPQSFQV